MHQKWGGGRRDLPQNVSGGYTPNVSLCIPGTQMTLVLIGKDLVLEAVKAKNRGQTGSRYIWGEVQWPPLTCMVGQVFPQMVVVHVRELVLPQNARNIQL